MAGFKDVISSTMALTSLNHSFFREMYENVQIKTLSNYSTLTYRYCAFMYCTDDHLSITQYNS